jgi:preprotein translocase subunit YajC
MSMNKLSKLLSIPLIVACIFSFTACSQQTTSSSQAKSLSLGTQKVSVTKTDSVNQTTVYGKVTEIKGSTVTIAIGTLQSGKKSFKNNSSSSKVTSRPASSGQGRKWAQGGFPISLTLTGSTKTITISDESIIKKPNMHNPSGSLGQHISKPNNASSSETSSATLSDINVGTILRVTYQTSGEKLISVIILGNNTSATSSK